MNYSEFLKTIISEFIEDIDGTTVTQNEVEDVTTLTITPTNKSDIAKLIGKKGRTISSLRVIMRAICNAKNDNGSTIKKIRIGVLGQ